MFKSGDYVVNSNNGICKIDGTVTMNDADLVDNAGNVIVAAGGASVEDSVITGTMNYFVAGVTEA